jgi:hypothetical protein
VFCFENLRAERQKKISETNRFASENFLPSVPFVVFLFFKHFEAKLSLGFEPGTRYEIGSQDATCCSCVMSRNMDLIYAQGRTPTSSGRRLHSHPGFDTEQD